MCSKQQSCMHLGLWLACTVMSWRNFPVSWMFNMMYPDTCQSDFKWHVFVYAVCAEGYGRFLKMALLQVTGSKINSFYAQSILKNHSVKSGISGQINITRQEYLDLQNKAYTDMNTHINLADGCRPKGRRKEEYRFVAVCNLDWCLSILCWKLLVKLVKDAIDSLYTQTTAMISQNHHHVCVCVLWERAQISEIQVTSHTGQSGVLFISLHCHVKETKTLLSFGWRQKGPGALTHQTNSGLLGAAGPSLSICSPLFITSMSCLVFSTCERHQLTIPAQSKAQKNIRELVPTFHLTYFKLGFWASENTFYVKIVA